MSKVIIWILGLVITGGAIGGATYLIDTHSAASYDYQDEEQGKLKFQSRREGKEMRNRMITNGELTETERTGRWLNNEFQNTIDDTVNRATQLKGRFQK